MMIPRRLVWLLLVVPIAGAFWSMLPRDAGNVPRAAATAPAPAPLAVAAATAVATSATHVGAAACAGCHPAQHAAWKGSHHALAMQHADASTVLGDFADARYRHGTVTTTFFRRDGRYFANTDGPDGALADFEIRYTFGVYPLQQYLVELDGGRLQALGIAWDSRPAAAGGQRWFHLHPEETIDHTDELHWTRRSYNWNGMCAECHSTAVRKNFDVAARRFDTRWAEINVGCEACHGPASRHLAWAGGKTEAAAPGTKGFAFSFDERRGVRWTIEAGQRSATRSVPRNGDKEIEVCARCHARRSLLDEGAAPGSPLMDSHLPVLPAAPLYHPDGQIRDEVFEYGSFVQSRMYQRGVTCSDCHEPHGQALRAPGNGVCLQCHAAAAFDVKAHHFHAPASAGARCTACHMPTTTYMVVHARHDHSIRIPRPDLSARLGTPNACNRCHADRDAAWAEAAIRRHRGGSREPGPHYGETLQAAAQGGAQAGQDLAALSLAPESPAIVRATAALLLADRPEAVAQTVLPQQLADPSPLVRHAALTGVERLPPAQRWALAGALLRDPVRAVRIEAGRVLAAAAPLAPTPDARAALDVAVDEYIAAALASAEHPQSHVNLGLLYQSLGEAAKAEASFRQALALDPESVPAWIDLADLQRQL